MSVAARPSGRLSGSSRTSASHRCSRRRGAVQRASWQPATCSSTREQQGRPEAGDLEVSPGRQARGRGEAARLVPVVDETGLQRRQDSSDEAQLAAAAEAAAAAVHERLLQRLRLADMTAVMSKAQPELVAIALGERCSAAAGNRACCCICMWVGGGAAPVRLVPLPEDPVVHPHLATHPPARAQHPPTTPPHRCSVPGARPAGPVAAGGVHISER